MWTRRRVCTLVIIKQLKKLKNKIKKYRPESDFSEPIVVTFGRKES
jgi:hypothetical protein